MKLARATATNVISSGNLESSSMGMDASGTAIASYYLRDKIYNDKVGAVIREYTTNALDEHYKHAVDCPVQISLKKIGGSWFFVVRDFAVGLPKDGIFSTYVMMFKSTKAKDNNGHGGFGIGSKSGHAYSDSFTLVSNYQGMATTYFCPLEPSDKAPVPEGKVYKISETPTSESGMEIRIPVKDGDVSEFAEKIKNFMRFVRHDAPIVAEVEEYSDNWGYKKNGFVLEPKEEVSLDIFPDVSLHQKAEEGYTHYYNHEFYIRMGDACYPMPSWMKNTYSGSGLKTNTILQVPIGTFSLPISREAIEDNEENREKAAKIAEAYAGIAKKELSYMKGLCYSLEELSKDRLTHGLFAITPSEAGYKFNNVEHHNYDYKDEDGNPLEKEKTFLVTIADNRSKKKWKNELDVMAEANRKYNFYWIIAGGRYLSESDKWRPMSEIVGDFEIIDVKDLKKKLVPRAKRGTGKRVTYDTARYVVFNPYSYAYSNNEGHRYSVDDINEMVEDGVPELKDIHNTDDLAYLCVHQDTQGHGIGAYTAKSQRAYDAFIAAGFYNYYDPKVQARRDEIVKEKREHRELDEYIKKFTHGYELPWTPSVEVGFEKSITKKQHIKKRAKVVLDRVEEIKKEDSTRGEILKALGTNKVSRATLRKILTLK